MVRYSDNNLQRIVRTIIETRPFLFLAPAPLPAPFVATAPHYEGPRERSLKARFPDVYQSKTHMECYNFFQKCKDHFAIAGAMRPNRVLFAATFLKNAALFCWQQPQHKVKNEINVSIT